MTITLELTEEQAHQLQARAAERGQRVEDYLLHLAEREPLSPEQWGQAVQELHELTKDLPPLPDEAFDRATMYRD